VDFFLATNSWKVAQGFRVFGGGAAAFPARSWPVGRHPTLPAPRLRRMTGKILSMWQTGARMRRLCELPPEQELHWLSVDNLFDKLYAMDSTRAICRSEPPERDVLDQVQVLKSLKRKFETNRRTSCAMPLSVAGLGACRC